MIRRFLQWLYTHTIGKLMAFFEVKSNNGTVMFAAEPSKRAMVYRQKKTAIPEDLYFEADNYGDVLNSNLPQSENCTVTYQAESADDVPMFFHQLPIYVPMGGQLQGIIQTSLRFNPSTLVWTAGFMAKNTGSFPVYIYSRIRDSDVPNKASPGSGVHLFDDSGETVFTTNKRPLNILTSYPISMNWANNGPSSPPLASIDFPTGDDMSDTDAEFAVAADVEDPENPNWTRDIYCTLMDNVGEGYVSAVQCAYVELNHDRERRWTSLFFADYIQSGWAEGGLNIFLDFALTLDTIASGTLFAFTGPDEVSGELVRARHPEDFFPNSTYNYASPRVYAKQIVGRASNEFFVVDSISTIYKTTDAAVSWEEVTQPAQISTGYWTLVKINETGEWLVYGLVDNQYAVYFSTDDMVSWTPGTVPGTKQLTAIMRGEPGVLIGMDFDTIAHTLTFYRSTDRGLTWSSLHTETFYQVHSWASADDGRIKVNGRFSGSSTDIVRVNGQVTSGSAAFGITTETGSQVRVVSAGGAGEWAMVRGSDFYYAANNGSFADVGDITGIYNFLTYNSRGKWIGRSVGQDEGYYTITDAGVETTQTIAAGEVVSTIGFDVDGRGLASLEDGRWFTAGGFQFDNSTQTWVNVVQDTLPGYNVPLSAS